MRKVIHNRIERRKKRVSANIVGSHDKPRISVFRSNKYIYAQAIDDASRSTVVSASYLLLKKEKTYVKGKKRIEAKQVGMMLAKLLMEKKITSGVFDRGRYSYNGRVKALAEGLREGGLKI